MTSRLMPDEWRIQYKTNDPKAFKRAFLNALEYRLAKDQFSATKYDQFLATAYAVAEHLIERWIVTQQVYHETKPKRIYYLSMEFLLGRTLENALINLDLYETCKEALCELGVDLSEILEYEADAGLGNGGLGRLAACFLDSMATLGLPAHGYCLRYEYGLFRQKILDGRQVEVPDHWLALPHPWEIERPEYLFNVNFKGNLEKRVDIDGRTRTHWLNAETVKAMPYDIPVPGYHTGTVNTLRLWTASANEEFNFEIFNNGDYMRASYDQVMSENITKVIYPNDNFFLGKELRLKQEYFLVSASIQDIVRRFKNDCKDWSSFPDLVAIQLNDTHPALAIPELMRILLDNEGIDWDRAWDITTRTFGYTNHTVLPEALEEWPVSLLEGLLPRHLDIIYMINHYFLKEVARHYPGDVDRLRRMSIVAEDGVKRVRMAFLAVVGSHHVNGVAELHTRLLKETILRDFHELWPGKFTNKTNGITPRRWLKKANLSLSGLITETIGDGWVKDLSQLKKLESLADDSAFQEKWRAARQANKEVLTRLILQDNSIAINPRALVDAQVKRIHEYKRQLLFALYIISEYLRIKDNPNFNHTPRNYIFGGKAAPGYWKAKLIIRLICRIADMVNKDASVENLIRVVYLPDYRVSLAEKLIPATDLSEQISTAGKEASGTSNMKFALNGALTIGTLDGANIEIMEEVGLENIFIFGLNANEVADLKQRGYRPRAFIDASPELQRVLHLLECDFFSPGEPGLFRPIFEELTERDEYLLMADFASYKACQEHISQVSCDLPKWTRMSILNVARSGKFSSDRTIAEYARDIWGVKGVDVPIGAGRLLSRS